MPYLRGVALDLNGKIEWESTLDDTRVNFVREIENDNLILVSSSGFNYFLWKYGKNGQCIWKTTLESVRTAPLIDRDGNIYIKNGFQISKINADGQFVWNIELGTEEGCSWNKIVFENNRFIYGFQENRALSVWEFNSEGEVIAKHIVQYFSDNPFFDSHTQLLYLTTIDDLLVAYDVNSRQTVYQTKLRQYAILNPFTYKNHIVIFSEKQVGVYKKDLTPVATHRLKGTVKCTNITEDGMLQILTSGYRAWDEGKSRICYSRLYEISG